MAWVRYDDQFPLNPKVTSVVGEDVGALALHLLANTWTNTQKHPGYVPAHQPAILLCDRGLATKWAAVLVHAELWHERGQECERCQEFYAGAPNGPGYVFHDAKEYRAPARDRSTPGTPADLSEKRREAGRAGGRAAAARRAVANAPAKPANQASATANQANGVANGLAKPVANPASQVANAAEPATTGAVREQAAGATTSDDTDDGLFGTAGFAGVSKTSKQREQRVSPGPVPDPGVASNEATTSVASLPQSASQGRASRATRIPANFAIDDEMRVWARQRVPQVDIDYETEKFLNYWRAKSGKDATKVDWVATWRNWMLKAAEHLPTRASPNGRSYAGPYREDPSKPRDYQSGSL